MLIFLSLVFVLALILAVINLALIVVQYRSINWQSPQNVETPTIEHTEEQYAEFERRAKEAMEAGWDLHLSYDNEGRIVGYHGGYRPRPRPE